MHVSESHALREILLKHGDVSPVLNLGSSTRYFREVSQPHIQRNLFGPLEAAGIKVFHSDLKDGDGIDLTGNILDPEVVDRLSSMNFKTIILSNLLEHVSDRHAVASACERIVGIGGHILVTVPKSYPYHPDPIDTMYRPSPEKLASIFKNSTLINGAIIEDHSFSEDLRRYKLNPAKELARLGIDWFTFRGRARLLLSRTHRWLWYSRRYKTSVAMLTVSRL